MVILLWVMVDTGYLLKKIRQIFKLEMEHLLVRIEFSIMLGTV